MAPKPRAAEAHQNRLDITDLVRTAPLNDQVSPYSNYAQVSISNFEVILDFFQLNPTMDRNPPLFAKHVQRVMIPISLGKGIATAIANVIAQFEADNNVTIPNGREPDPSDKIAIWK